MKKILFCYLFAQWVKAIAVGFFSGNPGYIVNGMGQSKPGLSPQIERRDQLLTVPVFITLASNSAQFQCTGTLVGKKYVLTAKHCFERVVSSALLNQDWQTLVIGENPHSVNIITYTFEALSEGNILQFGNVYKFTTMGVFSEYTPFNMISQGFFHIPSQNYEQIRVVKINTMAKGADMVLLTLASVPTIVNSFLGTIIDPENQVVFENYKTYFANEAKARRGNNDNQRLPELTYNGIEYMGFGSFAPDLIEDKNKLYLNLRSSVPPRIPYFLPQDVLSPAFINYQRAHGYSTEDCFALNFVSQAADSGDSGAAISYTDPLNPRQKKIIGVVHGDGDLNVLGLNRNLEDYYSMIVFGFNDDTIRRLNQLRSE